jgi:Ca-activated chloride channel family protein
VKQSEQAKDQQGKAAPKGSLSAADEKAGKEDPKSKEAVGKPEIVPEGAMTTQEAEKMLQAIRDQEMLRRLKRQATERNQHVPVDRDW